MTFELDIPEQKYNIVYADPPWSYKDKASAGKRGAYYKYDLMTLEEIKSIPIQQICANDCILFIWVTFPQLQEGLDTIKAWGFEYKTVGFVWIKRNKRKIYSWFMGMGNWTRSNAEVCLIGVRGNVKRVGGGVRSIIDTPIEGHSKKPDIVRKRIIELVGDLPRIELFARESKTGWDVMGNQIAEKTWMQTIIDE